MKPSEIKYTEEATPSDKASIEELLNKEQDLESLLLDWIRKPERGLTLTQGFDDDGEANQICAIFSLHSPLGPKLREIAEIYYHRAEVREDFSSVLEIASFVRGYDSNQACLVTREKQLVKWQKALGFTYHHTLSEPCGGYLAAIPYMMSYCLSFGGQASLTPYEKDLYDYAVSEAWGEIELPKLADLRMLSASYECKNPKLLGPEKPFGIPMFLDHGFIDMAKARYYTPRPRFKLERRMLRGSNKMVRVPTAQVKEETLH